MCVSCVDCMVLYVCRAYDAAPKYVGAELSSNLFFVVQLEQDVNGATRCKEFQEIVILGRFGGNGATARFSALGQSDCSISNMSSPPPPVLIG